MLVPTDGLNSKEAVTKLEDSPSAAGR